MGDICVARVRLSAPPSQRAVDLLKGMPEVMTPLTSGMP